MSKPRKKLHFRGVRVGIKDYIPDDTIEVRWHPSGKVFLMNEETWNRLREGRQRPVVEEKL